MPGKATSGKERGELRRPVSRPTNPGGSAPSQASSSTSGPLPELEVPSLAEPGPAQPVPGPPGVAEQGSAQGPAQQGPQPADVYAGPTESEELWSVLSYMGAIFLGPLAPLGVYLTKRGSQFIRLHATQSLNVALTCTLFGVSGVIVGGLLALDSPDAALIVMLPLAVAGWLIMLTQLIRGAIAASRGSYYELPRWICSPMIR